MSLSPQEHKLIRYMDQRNRANGQVPVMCTFEEVLAAVWDEEPLHTEGDVTHLIYELRQKLEPVLLPNRVDNSSSLREAINEFILASSPWISSR